jgi:hypothetical protein
VWGRTGKNGFGLAHIEEMHPDVLPRLGELVTKGVAEPGKAPSRVLLHIDNEEAVITLNRAGEDRRWVLTAYDTPSGRRMRHAGRQFWECVPRVQRSRLGLHLRAGPIPRRGADQVLAAGRTEAMLTFSVPRRKRKPMMP